jgi:hypothetical protein
MTPCAAFAGFPLHPPTCGKRSIHLMSPLHKAVLLRKGSSAHGNNGKGKNNDDAGGSRNCDGRGRDSGRGRTQTPIEQEPATAWAWRGQEAAPLGLAEKEQTVSDGLTISPRALSDCVPSSKADNAAERSRKPTRPGRPE